MIRQVPQLRVTEVQIALPRSPKSPSLLCFAAVVINGCLKLHGLRLYLRNDGTTLLGMPQRQRGDLLKDVVHPINDATRRYFRSAVESEYRRVIELAARERRAVRA